MKKVLKRVLVSIGCVVLALVLVVGGYAGYVFLSYSRIDDNQALTVKKTGVSDSVQVGVTYTVVTQNVGFGAYTPDFTFFMDGGKESRAKSKESVISCTEQASEKLKSFHPDFIIIQEVDTDSTRSYHVNQQMMFEKSFEGYSSVFAVNYHSAYLFYPIFEPHGKSNSGILTFAKTNITSSVRRQLPISTSVSKILDLDRCFTVSRMPVDGGKEFVLINTHMSAYGGSDAVRKGQMTLLFNVMKEEYEKGNYVVCGGDFNHDFTGDSSKILNGESADFGWAQPFPDDLMPSCLKKATDYENGEVIATCRNCDVPYGPDNAVFIVDGFIVTENVSIEKVQNIDNKFTYSDHNPVVMQFKLN